MDPLVIVLIIVVVLMVFSIGSADETISTIVGAGVIRLKRALLFGSILAFLGLLFLSASVGETVGANLLTDQVNYNVTMMLAVILSTSIWIIVASRTGAPISTTHSVVGAVFGIGIVWFITTPNSFFEAFNWLKIGEVFLGWFISPVLGFIGAYLVQVVVTKINENFSKGLHQIERYEKIYGYLLIFAVGLTQLSRGGNDSANAIGIYFGLINSGDMVSELLPVLMLISGLSIALGLYFVGRNVIKSVGGDLMSLRPSDAFAISASTSIVLLISTLLGLPVSGGHILIFSILGSGYVHGKRPDKRSFRKMVASWFITFPAAAILSAVCYIIFLLAF